MKTEIRDPLKWKSKGKITFQTKAMKWTDRLNDNLRKLGIGNFEETANNRQDWMRLCKGLLTIY